MKFNKLSQWVLVLGLTGPLLCGAADMSAPLLHPHTEGDVTYVSGGFGLDERQELDAVAKDYDLKLVFAGKGSGEYLADVKVSIANTKGEKILEAVSEGPWFLAKLPAGRYKVSAESAGHTLTQQARVGGKRLTQLHFYWPLAKEPEQEQQEPDQGK